MTSALKDKLLAIASQKNISLSNLEDIPETNYSHFKLLAICNVCQKSKSPSVSEFQKARFLEQTCKSSRCKNQVPPPSEPDTAEWKTIASLPSSPMTRKYKLETIQPAYKVSIFGQVKSTSRGTFIEQPSLSDKYRRVGLRTKDNKTKSVFVHVLVACAFVPLPEPSSSLTIEHLDGNTKNNHKDNLRWALPSSPREPSIDPGKFWVVGEEVYFREQDFKGPAEVFAYETLQEKLRLEDALVFQEENWRRITQAEQSFFVSSMGRVYHESHKKCTFGHLSPEGIMKFQNFPLDRLVAQAFLADELQDLLEESDLSPEDLLVRHKDNLPYNNKVSNLQWLGPTLSLSKPIIKLARCELDGREIDRFESLARAAKLANLSERTIRLALERKIPDPQGFLWVKASERPIGREYSTGALSPASSISPRSYSDGELPDLSSYLQNSLIKIPEKDFSELREHPLIVPAIMELLTQFSDPILPPTGTLATHYGHISADSTAIERDQETDELYITANNRGRPVLSFYMNSVMIKGHPQGKPSYEECWADLRLREKLVVRMLKRDKRMSNGSLYGCYGCEYGRLYNFPPNVAKALYNHFNSRRVLDFCAGYGGRLLGFWTSSAEEYLGIDPNTNNPYAPLIEYLGSFQTKKCTIIPACAEDVDYSTLGSFDTIFTSPPYFDTEIYAHEASQSCIRYPVFKIWLEKFLFAVLTKVIPVLSDGGILAVNIKDHKKHKIVEPMLAHLRAAGLTELQHVRLAQAKRYKTNTKYESIYVFRKSLARVSPQPAGVKKVPKPRVPSRVAENSSPKA